MSVGRCHLPPRVSCCKHVSCIEWSSGTPAQAYSIVAQSLAAFVEEEDVVDELNGKSFANTRTKCMNNSGSHEASIRCSLRCAKKAEYELQ